MLIGLTRLARRAQFLLNDNSTTILTGVGVVGTVTTAYLTGRSTFKAARIIDQEKSKREENHSKALTESNSSELAGYLPELNRYEKVKLVWRLYIPPFATGVTTVTAIVVANKIASKKIAALAIASGVSERALQEYKTKVVEKLGERQDAKIREEVAQERVLKNPKDTREVIIAGTGDVLCYDMLTGRYFMSTAEKIRRAENRINHELNNFMHASLTEFYDEVGLPPTTYTDHVGWNANDNLEVQISAVTSDDEKPCLALDFAPPPHSEYRKNLYD